MDASLAKPLYYEINNKKVTLSRGTPLKVWSEITNKKPKFIITQLIFLNMVLVLPRDYVTLEAYDE